MTTDERSASERGTGGTERGSERDRPVISTAAGQAAETSPNGREPAKQASSGEQIGQ